MEVIDQSLRESTLPAWTPLVQRPIVHPARPLNHRHWIRGIRAANPGAGLGRARELVATREPRPEPAHPTMHAPGTKRGPILDVDAGLFRELANRERIRIAQGGLNLQGL